MDIVVTPFHVLPIAFAVYCWLLLFFPNFPLVNHRNARLRWAALLVVCFGLLLWVLKTRSSPTVRDDADEVGFYLVFSLVWLTAAPFALSLLGISIREDVARRRNGAAEIAAAGFVFAVTCCAACSNVGDGPGFEAVLFCAVLSTGTLLLLWGVRARISGAADAITIDRRISSGILTGGWFIGAGMVLAASVAGDWVSLEATVRDFARYGWPVLPLTLACAVAERAVDAWQVNDRIRRAYSIGLAMAFMAAGGGYARWEWKH